MDLRRVFLRNTFPTYLTFAFIGIALGLNFLLTTPTFNPYNIDYWVIGTTFLVLGIAKLVFTLSQQWFLLRWVMVANIIFMIFWGIGTTITFFQGLTSLQLFVLYTGLVMLEFMLLIESSPTKKKK